MTKLARHVLPLHIAFLTRQDPQATKVTVGYRNKTPKSRRPDQNILSVGPTSNAWFSESGPPSTHTVFALLRWLANGADGQAASTDYKQHCDSVVDAAKKLLATYCEFMPGVFAM